MAFENIAEVISGLIAAAQQAPDTSYITDWYSKQRTAAEGRANKQADEGYKRSAVQRGFAPNDAYSQRLRSELYDRYYSGTDDALTAGEAGAIAQARQSHQSTQMGLIPVLLSIWKMQEDRAYAEKLRKEQARQEMYGAGGGGGGASMGTIVSGDPNPSPAGLLGQSKNPNQIFYEAPPGTTTAWQNGQLVVVPSPPAQGYASGSNYQWAANPRTNTAWNPSSGGYSGSYGGPL